MRGAALLLLPAAMALACSDEKSTVVVSVLSSGAPITRVAQLRVRATTGPSPNEHSQTLLYPEKPRGEDALLELNGSKPVTFSMSFSSTFKGTVTFDIDALDPNQGVLASGVSSPEQLGGGQVTYSTVWLSPLCEPTRPTDACGAGKSCALSCNAQNQAKTVCVTGGLTNPGDICSKLEDCVPGSECFEFACSPTSIKTCRKFCTSDADCGPGAACKVGITACSAAAANTLVCSRACNPTGSATEGCSTGLRCFLYAGEVTDCACSATTRTGGVGQTCSNDEACLPGLTCVEQGGQGTCRSLCVLATPVCPSGSTCTPFKSPGYRVYGACL